MKIIMFKVKDGKIFKCQDKKLDSKGNYIIFDKDVKRSKIWIWNGSQSLIKDRYLVGVSATSIKSREGLYGSKIEVIDESSESKKFQKLIENNIIDEQSQNKEYIIETLKVVETIKVPTIIEKPIQSSSDVQIQSKFSDFENKNVVSSIKDESINEKLEFTNIKERNIENQDNKYITPQDGILKQKIKGFLKEFSLNIESLQRQINIFLDDLD